MLQVFLDLMRAQQQIDKLTSPQSLDGTILGTDVDTDAPSTISDVFSWLFVVLEIVLMSTLVVIASSFLWQACRAEQKTASFIIKLLVLVDLVALAGISNATREAPWWSEKAILPDLGLITFQCACEFVYWTGAQWSTWIIAFQFYSTA